MPNPPTTSSRSVKHVPLNELHLDKQNPRLPVEKQAANISELELAKFIADAYDALDVANSIAEHGYFESEPLVVIEENGNNIVVEGNRRLVALKGLLDLSTRQALGGKWLAFKPPEELEWVLGTEGEVPVVRATSRAGVAPLLGYRHISGIAPWEPVAQARYVYNLVSNDGITFDETARLIGKPLTDVMRMYRDYDIVKQAEELFDLDAQPIRHQFGVFTKAMQTQALRDYLGAPPPRDVNTDVWPLEGTDAQSDSAKRLAQLITWIHGDAEGHGRVINDSRQLKDLGKVVEDPEALAILEESGSLEEALEGLNDPADRFSTLLAKAASTLVKAMKLRPAGIASEDVDRIDELIATLEELRRGTGNPD